MLECIALLRPVLKEETVPQSVIANGVFYLEKQWWIARLSRYVGR